MAKLSTPEAYFALSRIISYADGKMQEAEVDALSTIRMVEYLDLDIYDKIGQGQGDEEVFKRSIETLKEGSQEDRARACAWMLMTAMVAREGSVESKTTKWDTTMTNVTEDELTWITRAQKELGVDQAQLDAAFELIPRIRRLD